MLCVLHVASQCSSPLEYAVKNLPSDYKVTLYHFIKGFIESNPSESKKLDAMRQAASQSYQNWLRAGSHLYDYTFLREPWWRGEGRMQVFNSPAFGSQSTPIIVKAKEIQKKIKEINAKIKSLSETIAKKDTPQSTKQLLQLEKRDLLYEESKQEQALIQKNIEYETAIFNFILPTVEQKYKKDVEEKIHSLEKANQDNLNMQHNYYTKFKAQKRDQEVDTYKRILEWELKSLETVLDTAKEYHQKINELKPRIPDVGPEQNTFSAIIQDRAINIQNINELKEKIQAAQSDLKIHNFLSEDQKSLMRNTLDFVSYYKGGQGDIRTMLEELKKSLKQKPPPQPLVFAAHTPTISCEPTFAQWASTCNLLIRPGIPWGNNKKSEIERQNPILSADCFIGTLKNFVEKAKSKYTTYGLTITPEADGFNPFVGKMEFGNNAIIAFHGDLHGDVHSLMQFIGKLQESGYIQENSFTISNPNFYMMFLGDYVDRGFYGMEVIYTIIRLKLANPDKVFMVRGNHEDVAVNQYGHYLATEVKNKVDSQAKQGFCFESLHAFYNSLPVALYIGATNDKGHKDFLLCCHGGIEIGFDENALLVSSKAIDYQVIGDLARDTLYKKQNRYSQSVQEELERVNRWSINIELAGTPQDNRPKKLYLQDLAKGTYKASNSRIGFMWSDFQVDPQETSGYTGGRGLMASKKLSDEYLKNASRGSYSLRGIFRAHQHGDSQDEMMKRILNTDKKSPIGEEGVGKIWDREDKDHYPGNNQALWHGIVATFLVAPFTDYNKNETSFQYDAFGLLRLAPGFENWKLEVIRNAMPSK